MKPLIKNVIVAINGRQSSTHAAMYAIMMAKSYSMNIKFVFVVDTATLNYLSMNNLLIQEEKKHYEERLLKDGEHYLDYVEMLARAKGVRCQKELRRGAVFTEILNAAKEFEADLILIGGNEDQVNKKGLKSFAMNRDENEVFANSSCPIMIVQKKDLEKEFKVF